MRRTWSARTSLAGASNSTGAFLVADDMMDASVTRRGGPCWYKLPEVQTIAINDAFLLYRSLFAYC